MGGGVIMLRNFPHGFYEQQMVDYFKQFGRVERLRLLRSRKTHRSKKVAFIEFACSDVAKIAAEAMNNYLMFDHLMTCQFVPENKVPPHLFDNWRKPLRFTTVQRHKMKTNNKKTPEMELRSRKKKLRILHKATQLLRSFGIEYECLVIRNDEGLSKNSLASDSSDNELKKKVKPELVTPKKSNKHKNIDVFDLKQVCSERKSRTPKSMMYRSLPKYWLLKAATRRSL